MLRIDGKGEKKISKSLQGRRVATALRDIAGYHAIQVEPSRNPEKVVSSPNITYELYFALAGSSST